MNKRKIFLYVSAAAVWVFIVFCTFIQDQRNSSIVYYDEPQEEPTQIALNENITMIYGPLSSTDTQVTLKYGFKEVNVTVPVKARDMTYQSVQPAGEKHIAATFKNSNSLDTVVLFNSQTAQVFQHVVAMDSDTGRIAYLVESRADQLSLVISTFDNRMLKTLELDNHTAAFLQNPKVETAIFLGSDFKIDTVLGSYSVSLQSLI